MPVPLIYLDEARSFGGSLDDGGKRLEYYHRVLDRAIADIQATLHAAEQSQDAECQDSPDAGCRCS